MTSTPQLKTATVSPSAARAALCAAVSIPRHSTRNGESRARQISRQTFGCRQAVRCRPPVADHEHGRLPQIDAPAREDENRRIENFLEQRRIARIAESDDLEHFFLLHHGVLERATAGYTLGQGAADTRRLQFTSRTPENRLGTTKLCDQFGRDSGTQSRDQLQRDPVQFLLAA